MRNGELFIEMPHGEMLGFDDVMMLSGSLEMMPGTIAICPANKREKLDMIYLPDRMAANTRPDSGTVIAVGDGVPLAIGDIVLYRPYHGKWIGDFEVDGKVFEQIRLYGVTKPWRQSIVAKKVGNDWKPVADWVIVERDDNLKVGEILIHFDSGVNQSSFATVIDVGPETDGVKPKDRIIINDEPNCGMRFRFQNDMKPYQALRQFGDRENNRHVKMDNIYAVIENEDV